MSTFQAFWPILDPKVRVLDLIEIATPELPEVAVRAHVRLLEGRVEWKVMPGRAVPGAGGYPQVLVARCPGVPVDNYGAARRAWQAAQA